MQFDYSKYLENSIFSVVIVGLNIYLIIKTLIYYCRLFISKKNRQTDVFSFSCILVVLGLVISINASRLIHGGAYLLFERETDRTQVQGQIEQVEELDRWGVPKLDVDGGSGVQLTISGIQCRTISDVSLAVGDYVFVEYLPKSGYVLYICEITPE